MVICMPFNYIKEGLYNSYEKHTWSQSGTCPGAGCVKRSGGTYLAAYHVGHWQTLNEAYERMLAYAESAGLTLCGGCYEDYLLGWAYTKNGGGICHKSVLQDRQCMRRVPITSEES